MTMRTALFASRLKEADSTPISRARLNAGVPFSSFYMRCLVSMRTCVRPATSWRLQVSRPSAPNSSGAHSSTSISRCDRSRIGRRAWPFTRRSTSMQAYATLSPPWSRHGQLGKTRDAPACWASALAGCSRFSPLRECVSTRRSRSMARARKSSSGKSPISTLRCRYTLQVTTSLSPRRHSDASPRRSHRTPSVKCSTFRTVATRSPDRAGCTSMRLLPAIHARGLSSSSIAISPDIGSWGQ